MKPIFLILFFLSVDSVAQEIKTLEPQIGERIQFTADFIENFNSQESLDRCYKIWQKMREEGREWGQETPKEKEILKYCDEVKEDVWEILGGGCSWYCGGGPIKVTASSFLESQGSNTYTPNNAHDLSYKNSWVEGVSGYGTGEYLTYYFAPECPRITEIIILNGYIKSELAWSNNSRVKLLKMYINDEPYAYLKLKDTSAKQHFKVPPIGNGDRTDLDKLRELENWSIKFQIMEVYPGEKFDDTAITEIYFDGIDVH